jgi:hypothetical protein
MGPADVARHNTFMMMTASSYVYSHRHDFPWLDAEGRIQTDASLFSKSTIRRGDEPTVDLPPCGDGPGTDCGHAVARFYPFSTIGFR